MPDTYSAKSDLYQDFLLCVKFHSGRIYDFYENFYEILKDEGWILEKDLQQVEDDISCRDYDFLGIGKLTVSPEGETIAILEHETGPEIWIVPVTTFIAGAVASGILGNAAYDLIRKLYVFLNRARKKTVAQSLPESDEVPSHVLIDILDDHDRDTAIFLSIELRTPDYQTLDLVRLPPKRQQEVINRTIQTRMRQLCIDQPAPSRMNIFEKQSMSQEIELRVSRLENQVKNLTQQYVTLASEFQKERAEWRRRSGKHSNPEETG